MLNHYDVMGFIPVPDAVKAKAFYIDVLGLTYISENAFKVEMESNGTRIQLVNVPAFKAQGMTILGWRVPDLVVAVKEMAAKGITFEHYDGFGQDELGIWSSPSGTRIAWFKDPDGNTLSLSEHHD